MGFGHSVQPIPGTTVSFFSLYCIFRKSMVYFFIWSRIDMDGIPMKQKTRWHDALVLAAVLCAAFLIVTGTQQITGRIDGVASMVFVLAVF